MQDFLQQQPADCSLQGRFKQCLTADNNLQIHYLHVRISYLITGADFCIVLNSPRYSAMMSKDSKTIGTGSRVAIIGGGPAASLFALYLIHFTEKKGIYPEITIYQKRDFDEQGARGCKGCAGILSISLQRNLGELGLTIPEGVFR